MAAFVDLMVAPVTALEDFKESQKLGTSDDVATGVGSLERNDDVFVLLMDDLPPTPPPLIVVVFVLFGSLPCFLSVCGRLEGNKQ